jgi:hypothetical protein
VCEKAPKTETSPFFADIIIQLLPWKKEAKKYGLLLYVS